MNTPVRIALLCALVVVAALSGFWLGRGGRNNDDSASVFVTPSATVREVAQLQIENQRLRVENALLSKTEVDALRSAKNRPSPQPTALQQLSMLAEAQKAKTVAVRMTIVGRDGNLTDGFTKLFGLSEAEKQTLKGALDHARQRIDQLSASTTTAKQEGNALVVAISPFDGGSDVYDGLMEAFERTLGPERNAAFIALQTDQLSGTFSAFGAEQRILTLSREAIGDADPKIAVRDQRKTTNGNMVSVNQVPNTEELVQRYPSLAPYVDRVSGLPVQTRPVGPPRPDTIRP